MKRLVYGTHLILDGYGLEASAGKDGERVEGFLTALDEFWPLGVGAHYIYQTEGGASAVKTGRHGYALLHLFTGRGWLVADMFTAAEADPTAAATIIERAFELSRFDLRISRRSRLLPEGEDELKRAVLGERHYAEARLTPLD